MGSSPASGSTVGSIPTGGSASRGTLVHVLTQDIINEFATLLAVEDQTIWDVGDKINQYELGHEDIEKLSEEVDRSVALLVSRAHLAKMFPADMWDRMSAPIGVWEQLSRLDTPAERLRMLKKKVWTVSALRREINELLERPAVVRAAKTQRVTRFDLNGATVSMKSTLSEKGLLSLALPGKLAKGSKVKVDVGDNGELHVSIPLDVASLDVDPDVAARHLRAVE